MHELYKNLSSFRQLNRRGSIFCLNFAQKMSFLTNSSKLAYKPLFQAQLSYSFNTFLQNNTQNTNFNTISHNKLHTINKFSNPFSYNTQHSLIFHNYFNHFSHNKIHSLHNNFNLISQYKLNTFYTQKRLIATQPVNVHLPPPPPKEFDEFGNPKKYRLTYKIYDHKYNWERWALMPAGVFHTVYYGEFGRDYKPYIAYLLNFPLWISLIPFFIFSYFVSYCISNMGCIGVRPKRYSVEWMLASKERDRVENTNPMTRYLDRRRKERGPNWLLEDYMPTHPHFLFFDRYIHDKELQENN